MKSIFLYIIYYRITMKKFAVILLVTFVTALVASSCNKKECPAYSKGHSRNNTEQADENV